MRNLPVFRLVLIVLLALCIGILIGQKIAPMSSAESARAVDAPTPLRPSMTATTAVHAAVSRPVTNTVGSFRTTPAATVEHKTIPLSDVNAAIRNAMTNSDFGKRYQAIQELARSIAMADIPAALAMAEKITNQQTRQALMQALVMR